ncbi:MAG: prepilin-type N-terminal cleavage/methylation domain-containing protein [Pseudomonadota bacterium]
MSSRISRQTLTPHRRPATGFTLIELMITVTILSILLVFAVPTYQTYIRDSQEGVIVSNIHTIEMFQEDELLRTGAYAVGLADIAAIEAAIGWNPRSNDGVLYAVAANGTGYDVTATHPDGWNVCITFPDKTRCVP